VLEAALLHLVKLKAAQLRHEEGHMQSFNSFLLLYTLRGIAVEIERVDPGNSALTQLRYFINQKAAELAGDTQAEHQSVPMPGAA